MPLSERKGYYLVHRIDEQKKWYANKSSWNVCQRKKWFALLVSCQISAIIFVVLRVAYPEGKYFPIEIFLIGAGAVLTWIQAKKFRELASAYALTAHEIGIMRDGLEGVACETAFAQFVIDSESAFSREHTQWLARKDVV